MKSRHAKKKAITENIIMITPIYFVRNELAFPILFIIFSMLTPHK